MSISRLVSLLIAAALPLTSQSEEFKWGSVNAGATFFGESTYKEQLHYGLSGGWWFTPRWAVELRGTRGNVTRDDGVLVAHQWVGSMSALWRVWPGESQWQPYLALGVGSTRNYAYGISTSGLFHGLESRPEYHGGVGVFRRFGEHGLLTLDYRLLHTGIHGTQFNDHLVTVGVGLTFGEGRAQMAPPAPLQPLTPTPPAPLPPAPAPVTPSMETAKAAPAAAPAPAPAPPRKLLVKGAVVRFANDQARLDPGGRESLERVAQSLRGLEGRYQVKVTGHASRIGPKAHNQRLSLQRAQAAAEHLIQEGVPASAIQVEARGVAEPQADNRTRKGRDLNRRAVVAVKGDGEVVEIQVLDTGTVTRKVPHKAGKPSGKHATKAHAAKAGKHHGKGKATPKKTRSKSRK